MQVTLEKAKNYLRVDSSDDDALIKSLITTAETLVKETSRMSDEELAPYKEVVTHGFIQDSAGEKMSKSKGNGVDPIRATLWLTNFLR